MEFDESFVDRSISDEDVREILGSILLPGSLSSSAADVIRALVRSPDAMDRLSEMRWKLRTRAYSQHTMISMLNMQRERKI